MLNRLKEQQGDKRVQQEYQSRNSGDGTEFGICLSGGTRFLCAICLSVNINLVWSQFKYNKNNIASPNCISEVVGVKALQEENIENKVMDDKPPINRFYCLPCQIGFPSKTSYNRHIYR